MKLWEATFSNETTQLISATTLKRAAAKAVKWAQEAKLTADLIALVRRDDVVI